MQCRLISVVLFASLAACGDNHAPHEHHGPDAAAPDGPPAARAVTIAFAAEVGGAPFACGEAYAGIGTAASTYVGSDFRFYVHDVRLVGEAGEVPVVLDANEFQADGVALLDFETGGTGCQMGSTSTHTAVTGTVPAGTYTGVAFKVGVPFAKNHLDVATAASPLNIPAMYWAWSSGYKFLKIDGAVGAAGFNVHLGSTGCTTMGTTPPTTPCANPNIMDVALAGFDPETGVIVADVAPVLAGVDVTRNTAATAPGCMSFPNDPECDTVLPNLGIAYGANPAGAQRLFSVE